MARKDKADIRWSRNRRKRTGYRIKEKEGRKEGRKSGGGVAALLKSGYPHLAGGELQYGRGKL